MDVTLYVYDLSRGLARQFSSQLLGTYIDAVYHTAIVLDGIEYFYGAGVQTTYAGSTHHGQPMEKINLGRTNLPLEIVLEYLDSLKQIYTAEAYDLFLHNCNNFSNDFAMFLVGKGIPDHITSLPQTVLKTPFGQMLKPQLDAAMRPITQAPVPDQRSGYNPPSPVVHGKVHNVTDTSKLIGLLQAAESSCAVIFFTSSTCAPCKICYPVYDQLAEEAGSKATLIKVDINHAREIAAQYAVRATPTFMTFLKGAKDEEWAGADPNRLRGTVRLLINSARPPHPHRKLNLPQLSNSSLKPITYTKVPPLDKVLTKLGDLQNDRIVPELRRFIVAVHGSSPPQEAPVPSLPSVSAFMDTCLSQLPQSDQFAAYDIFRLLIADTRVGAYFAEEADNITLVKLLKHVNDDAQAPYNLRIVCLHLACNIFASKLASHVVLSRSTLVRELVTLVTTSLLDEAHNNGRISAGSLVFNMAATNHRSRIEKDTELLDGNDQVEMVAGIIEALGREKESKEAVRALSVALGLLIFCAPQEAELLDLCRAMEASAVVKSKLQLSGDDAQVREIATILLVQGLDI